MYDWTTLESLSWTSPEGCNTPVPGLIKRQHNAERDLITMIIFSKKKMQYIPFSAMILKADFFFVVLHARCLTD